MSITRNYLFSLVLGLSIVAFLLPASASASYYRYTCDDFTLTTGVTCTDDILTFNGISASARNNLSPSFPLIYGQVYYIRHQTSGNGGRTFGRFHDLVTLFTVSNTDFRPDGVTKFPLITPIGIDSYLWINSNAVGGGPLFQGDISEICISDTSYAECAPGGYSGLLANPGQSSIALLAGVASSVQDTGSNIWPLLAIMGIPIAFIIGEQVIKFIRRATGMKVETKK